MKWHWFLRPVTFIAVILTPCKVGPCNACNVKVVTCVQFGTTCGLENISVDSVDGPSARASVEGDQTWEAISWWLQRDKDLTAAWEDRTDIQKRAIAAAFRAAVSGSNSGFTVKRVEMPQAPSGTGLEGLFVAGGIALLLAILNSGWQSVRNGNTRRRKCHGPPVSAEFLFYLFLSPQNCDALVGDLEERYTAMRKKFGRRHANFWYWTQTLMSLAPIVWAWVKKVSLRPVAALLAWAVAKGLLGHDSWLAALVELWKRIRS